VQRAPGTELFNHQELSNNHTAQTNTSRAAVTPDFTLPLAGESRSQPRRGPALGSDSFVVFRVSFVDGRQFFWFAPEDFQPSADMCETLPAAETATLPEGG